MPLIDDLELRNIGDGALPVAAQRTNSEGGLLPFRFIGAVALASDCVVIIGSSLISAIAYHELFLDTLGPIDRFIALGAFVFANFAAIQAGRGYYSAQYLFDTRKQSQVTSATWILTFVLLLVAAFAFKFTASYSRAATLTFFFTGWASLIASRHTLTWFLKRTLAKGEFATRRVIAIADRSQINTSDVVLELEKCGYTPLKIFEIDLTDERRDPLSKQSLSDHVLDGIVQTTRKHEIESVFLQIPWTKRRAIDRIMNQLRVLSIPVYLLPDADVSYFLNQQIIHLGMGWSAELKRAPLSTLEQLTKRGIDLFLSTLVLLMLAPLMVAIAIIIKLDSPGPVFFLQTRNGFNGRPFRIFKFRTMRVLEDGESVTQATRNDPRVTRFGRILRRANADELPQIFNVISGSMSLVGPRPHAAAHNNEYEKLIANYAFRYHMRPGITGWAQIQGLRGETKTLDSMVKRVDADLWYINNWSIWLDMKILLRTLVLGIQPSAY